MSTGYGLDNVDDVCHGGPASRADVHDARNVATAEQSADDLDQIADVQVVAFGRSVTEHRERVVCLHTGERGGDHALTPVAALALAVDIAAPQDQHGHAVHVLVQREVVLGRHSRDAVR